MAAILFRSQCVNSLWPSGAMWLQTSWSTSVQAMACRCSAPSHQLKQWWQIVDWTLMNKLQWNFHQIWNIFNQENAPEYVLYEMAAISLRPHWGPDNMAAILQTTFSHAFPCMKIIAFWLKFPWNLFPEIQLTISQHWFCKWLAAEEATCHLHNQWWYSLLTHISVTLPPWVKSMTIVIFVLISHPLN